MPLAPRPNGRRSCEHKYGRRGPTTMPVLRCGGAGAAHASRVPKAALAGGRVAVWARRQRDGGFHDASLLERRRGDQGFCELLARARRRISRLAMDAKLGRPPDAMIRVNQTIGMQFEQLGNQLNSAWVDCSFKISPCLSGPCMPRFLLPTAGVVLPWQRARRVVRHPLRQCPVPH